MDNADINYYNKSNIDEKYINIQKYNPNYTDDVNTNNISDIDYQNNNPTQIGERYYHVSKIITNKNFMVCSAQYHCSFQTKKEATEYITGWNINFNNIFKNNTRYFLNCPSFDELKRKYPKYKIEIDYMIPKEYD